MAPLPLHVVIPPQSEFEDSTLSPENGPKLAKLVAVTLDKIIQENMQRQLLIKKPVPAGADVFLKFQSSYEPEVSVEYYLSRLARYSKCSDACLVLLLIYIDRLIEQQGLVLTNLNAHRMILTSLMVAAKYHDDLFYNNAYFAKLGGIPATELNALEVDFLTLMSFACSVPHTSFEHYLAQLVCYQAYLDSQIPQTQTSQTSYSPIASCTPRHPASPDSVFFCAHTQTQISQSMDSLGSACSRNMPGLFPNHPQTLGVTHTDRPESGFRATSSPDAQSLGTAWLRMNSYAQTQGANTQTQTQLAQHLRAPGYNRPSHPQNLGTTQTQSYPDHLGVSGFRPPESGWLGVSNPDSGSLFAQTLGVCADSVALPQHLGLGQHHLGHLGCDGGLGLGMVPLRLFA